MRRAEYSIGGQIGHSRFLAAPSVEPATRNSALRAFWRSADLAADRTQVLETFAVSRETTARFDRFVALLLTSQS
jgi:hypothetical protein